MNIIKYLNKLDITVKNINKEEITIIYNNDIKILNVKDLEQFLFIKLVEYIDPKIEI